MPPELTPEQRAREALASNPFPPTRWVTVADEGILIATGYSEALNRLLRWVPKAKWRPDKRCWLIPLSGAEAVRAVLPEITRLADAARELNEREPAPPKASFEPEAASTSDARSPLVEAAELLHGQDWRGVLAREFDDPTIFEKIYGQKTLAPDEPLVAALVVGLRRKAEAFVKAADRLEARLGPEALGREPAPRRP